MARAHALGQARRHAAAPSAHTATTSKLTSSRAAPVPASHASAARRSRRSFSGVDHLERVAEPAARLRLHLAEDEPPAAARDQVELVPRRRGRSRPGSGSRAAGSAAARALAGAPLGRATRAAGASSGIVRVAERLERAAVDLAGAALAHDRRVARRDVADVAREAVVRVERVHRGASSRSRTTFATIEAAAIAALFSSPSTTARCGGAVGPRRKPSTRQPRRAGASAAERRAQAARFERWSPLRSIAAGGITRTTTCSAQSSDGAEQLLARSGDDLLRVVQLGERPDAVVAQAP